jgi:hypothetical protein
MGFSYRIQEDGPRNAVLWIDDDGQTSTGAVTPVPPGVSLITPGQLGYVDISRLLRAKNLRIDKIEWDINGEASQFVELIWVGSAGNAVAYHMIGRANKYFKDFGGLYPPSSIGTLTGINIAAGSETSDPTVAPFNGTYTIILYLVKSY